jgi:DNA-binding transcriptional LysR family regulator
MQFESLKFFCDLADMKSFTQTAQLNGVTQSAISQTLTVLERHLKSRLIERSRKNLRLTEEGQALYDSSKELLQIYGAMRSKLQGLEHVVSGEIRLATLDSIGLYDLPPYVKECLRRYPNAASPAVIADVGECPFPFRRIG